MAWPPGDLHDVIAFLGDKRTGYGGGSRNEIALPWKLSPGDYVAFARTDLRGSGQRGLVNALSNAKRALHCQVDSILFCSGLWEIAERRHWRLPQRIGQVESMHVAAAAVLRRINQHRNEVEHEYGLPRDREWLEDLVDIVDIFVQGTSAFSSGSHDGEYSKRFRTTERYLGIYYQDKVIVVESGRDVIRVEPLDPMRPALVAAHYSALVRNRAMS